MDEVVQRRKLSRIELIPLCGEVQVFSKYLNIGTMPLSMYFEAVERRDFDVLRSVWHIRCRHYLISTALFQNLNLINLIKDEYRTVQWILYENNNLPDHLLPILYIEERIAQGDKQYLDALKKLAICVNLYTRNEQIFDRFSLVCQMPTDFIERETIWLKSQTKESIEKENKHDYAISRKLNKCCEKIRESRTKGSNISDLVISDMLEEWAVLAFSSVTKLYRPQNEILDFWLNEMRIVNKRIGRTDRTKFWLEQFFSLPLLYQGRTTRRYYESLKNAYKIQGV